MAENCGAETLPPSMISTAQNGASSPPVRFPWLRRNRMRQWQLVSVAALLGGWWVLSTQTTPLTLPGPIPVLVALVRLLFS